MLSPTYFLSSINTIFYLNYWRFKNIPEYLCFKKSKNTEQQKTSYKFLLIAQSHFNSFKLIDFPSMLHIILNEYALYYQNFTLKHKVERRQNNLENTMQGTKTSICIVWVQTVWNCETDFETTLLTWHLSTITVQLAFIRNLNAVIWYCLFDWRNAWNKMNLILKHLKFFSPSVYFFSLMFNFTLNGDFLKWMAVKIFLYFWNWNILTFYKKYIYKYSELLFKHLIKFRFIFKSKNN